MNPKDQLIKYNNSIKEIKEFISKNIEYIMFFYCWSGRVRQTIGSRVTHKTIYTIGIPGEDSIDSDFLKSLRDATLPELEVVVIAKERVYKFKNRVRVI